MTTLEAREGELVEFPKVVEWKISGLNTQGFGTLTSGIKKSPSFSYANNSWYLRLSRGRTNTVSPFVFANNSCSSCSVSLVRESGCLTGVITKRFTVFNGVQLLKGKTIAFRNPNASGVLGEEEFEYVSYNDVRTVLCYLKFDPSEKQDLLFPNFPPPLAIETLHQLKLTETDVLSKDLKDLFTNKDNCDTVLQVKDKEFKVHKFLLIARSSVFAAMFRHDTSENQTGVVNIPDCDSESFNDFLKYLYCGKLEDISFDGAANLYRTSDKYDVQELKAFCLKYMMQTLTVQNVCDAVILADECDETELMSAIQAFFNENVKNILVTSEWERLMKSNYRLANKLLIEMSNICRIVL